MSTKSLIQWENMTKESGLVWGRGSKKAVCSTFEIHLHYAHFSAPPPSLSHLPSSLTSMYHVGSSLAPSFHCCLFSTQMPGDPSKTKVKSCYLSVRTPAVVPLINCANAETLSWPTRSSVICRHFPLPWRPHLPHCPCCSACSSHICFLAVPWTSHKHSYFQGLRACCPLLHFLPVPAQMSP